MTEYWVSKKQYWCKYCSIFIRDDAPSRRQHETGFRHIGAKERFIRDLYKTGNMAKRDKEREAQEMARIDAAAQIAHAQDVPVAGPSRTSVLYAQGHAGPSTAASGPKRPDKPKDKFANYSTAAQLGLAEEETAPTTYEVDQTVGGKDTKVGQWEEIVNEPTGLSSTDTERHGAGPPAVEDDEEAEGEGWKFQHKGKRPVRDPYDDDDFDPTAILKMRKRVKAEGEAQVGQVSPEATLGGTKEKEEEDPGRELDREAWSGRIDLDGKVSQKKRDGLVYQAGGGWVKEEEGVNSSTSGDVDRKSEVDGQSAGNGDKGEAALDRKPDLDSVGVEVKPDLENASATTVQAQEAPAASGGLFKKRRPPPSNRKK